MIYTLIFSEEVRNETVERKTPKRYTFYPDDTNTIYWIRIRNKAKTFIQRRKSLLKSAKKTDLMSHPALAGGLVNIVTSWQDHFFLLTLGLGNPFVCQHPRESYLSQFSKQILICAYTACRYSQNLSWTLLDI